MANESVIKLFEGKKVRVVWNEELEKYYFAVQDIVQVLTDSTDVKQYVKRLRSRDKELDSVWGTICTPHQFVSTDGKKHAVNCADLQGILRIIQSIPSKKAEPIKRWLAQVGSERFYQLRNARADIEQRLGHSVISSSKAIDYITPQDELPFSKDKEE